MWTMQGIGGNDDQDARFARSPELLTSSPPRNVSVRARKFNDIGMRSIDIIVAALAIIFFGPLLVIVAVAVWVSDPGPIFFGHKRVGQHGRYFRCWKFRTMTVNAEACLAALLKNDSDARIEWERDHKLRNDPRITWAGRFLRRSSLDELPQLFNVLRGQMSLVGPRPIVEAEIARYGTFFPEYCSVRPGITGLWQISGRNDVSYTRRVALDVAYVQSKNLKLDLTILCLTVPRVLLARGSY